MARQMLVYHRPVRFAVRPAAIGERSPGGLPVLRTRGTLTDVTQHVTPLELDDLGVASGLPRPSSPNDRVEGVPYRAVEFRDDDLAAALERSADWLRQAENWLGEAVDVIAVHLDYDDSKGSPYFALKLLCNEEDLAGAPIAVRQRDTTADA